MIEVLFNSHFWKCNPEHAGLYWNLIGKILKDRTSLLLKKVLHIERNSIYNVLR